MWYKVLKYFKKYATCKICYTFLKYFNIYVKCGRKVLKYFNMYVKCKMWYKSFENISMCMKV